MRGSGPPHPLHRCFSNGYSASHFAGAAPDMTLVQASAQTRSLLPALCDHLPHLAYRETTSWATHLRRRRCRQIRAWRCCWKVISERYYGEADDLCASSGSDTYLEQEHGTCYKRWRAWLRAPKRDRDLLRCSAAGNRYRRRAR